MMHKRFTETVLFRRSIIYNSIVDLCMEESTCHEMVIHLSHRFSSMLCLCICCVQFSLVLNVIFTLTLKELKLKCENCKEISGSMVKKMYGTILLP